MPTRSSGALVEQGFVEKLGSIDDVKATLNGEMPVTSKMALITTLKDDKLKHRLTLDSRVSGANDHATKHERVLPPKLWDVIADTVLLHSMLKEGNSVDVFICDFRDVFFMIPLLPPRTIIFLHCL